MIDHIVVTAYPGYFFMSVLCIRSIQQYLPDIPITIIVDDFGLGDWTQYPEQYQNYITSQFPTTEISYRRYSEIPTVDNAQVGGWFRQQLIKLYVDQFVTADRILLIDADVILKEIPGIDTVPAKSWPVTPISIGFHLYVEFMLGIEPWLGTRDQNLGSSWVPVRFVTQDLLQSLRNHVERRHNKNFLELHLELMKQQKIVAFDPECKTMIMSEFEMLEVFRRHLWKQPLPLVEGHSDFYHTSEKDWQLGKTWLESHQVTVEDNLWNQVMLFGSNPAIQ